MRLKQSLVGQDSLRSRAKIGCHTLVEPIAFTDLRALLWWQPFIIVPATLTKTDPLVRFVVMTYRCYDDTFYETIDR